jgi:hypothetical protein
VKSIHGTIGATDIRELAHPSTQTSAWTEMKSPRQNSRGCEFWNFQEVDMNRSFGLFHLGEAAREAALAEVESTGGLYLLGGKGDFEPCAAPPHRSTSGCEPNRFSFVAGALNTSPALQYQLAPVRLSLPERRGFFVR